MGFGQPVFFYPMTFAGLLRAAVHLINTGRMFSGLFDDRQYSGVKYHRDRLLA